MPDRLTGGGLPAPGDGSATPSPAQAAPLGTPGSAPAPRRLDPRLRALLVSLIVVAAGAALGTGGFIAEQSRATWRPQVAATGDGWRITTSHGLRLGDAALGGEHLVWDAGPFTLLTALNDGRTRLLGAAAFAGNASAPSASETHAVWMETHSATGSENVVWAFDIGSGRRARLEGTEGITRSPAVAGSTAVWAVQLADGRGWLVRGTDIRTGRDVDIAETAAADDLTAGGTLAAWTSRRVTPTAPPVITVADIAGDLRRQVAPYAEGRSGRLIGFAVAGRALLWARGSGTSMDEIVSFDVDTGTTRVLASAPRVQALAAAGDLLVWVEGLAGGGGRVMGLRLSAGGPYVSMPSGGAPFLVAEVSGGALTDVYAGADVAAWRVRGALLFDSYLQTARVP